MAFELSEMKRDFGDAAAEAKACRAHCALFDFSFLECVQLKGSAAGSLIETFTGRSVGSMKEGQISYALRVDAEGRAAADLTIWRTGPEAFDVMSGRRQDIPDLFALAGSVIEVADKAASQAVFSVQGPAALDALRPLGEVEAIARLGYFNFARADLIGLPCTIGRLGYTGEAGFEIITARERASEVWGALSAHARPAGFIAADMLRIEAGFVLFTNEFRLPVVPHEAGLGKFYPSAQPPGLKLKLVSFQADAENLEVPWRPAKAPARPGTRGVIAVTSACHSIAARGILGLGYVLEGTAASTPLIDPSGRFRNIRLTPLPFYDPSKARARAPWR